MQSKAIYGKPVVESVTITMTADQAKLLHRFLAGTTSNTVIEATNLKYDNGDDDLIYGINDALFEVHSALTNISELDLPSYY